MNKLLKALTITFAVMGVFATVGLATGYLTNPSTTAELQSEVDVKDDEIHNLYSVIDNQREAIAAYEDDIEQLEEWNMEANEQLTVKTDVLNQLEARQDREFYMEGEQ